MIIKTLEKINKNSGILFFNNPNTLYYNIFNKLHKYFIANEKIVDTELKDYIDNGYIKTKINSTDLCNKINTEIKKQKIEKDKYFHDFEISDKMKQDIKYHFNKDFKNILNKFGNLYNSKVAIAKIRIRRNFHLNNPKNEVYSNYYHVDHYVYNHFKIFINLMDTKIENGPLHIYSKKDTAKFLKKNKYKNRNNYIDKDLPDILKINTGKKGESFIANTTECLHKAGEVKKDHYRDILFITLITVPQKTHQYDDFFYYDKVFPNSIWENNHVKIEKIAKPQSFRQTMKLLISYYKNRIN